MSFGTSGVILDECLPVSKLELTKNPFDNMEERLNLPYLSSPLIFTKQETPSSEKKKGFRWSIDQISKLDPADIDEFPNQEYSSTYERPEDETRAQEAINEYFSHGTILPSPWTPENHVKHVTFSPLPPTTAYISGEDDSMTDVSHNSGNESARTQRQIVDAGCQTSLTFPPSFDLSKIVDSGFYSYSEDEGSLTGRDLNVSSLRRKLFSQDEQVSPLKSSLEQLSQPIITRSILKSPSPNLLTSSPVKSRRYLHPDLDSPFSINSRTSQSPGVSPIKRPPTLHTQHPALEESEVQFDGTLSNDDVFSSNVLESSDVCIHDHVLIPDVSPIKHPNAHGTKSADQHDDGSEEESGAKGDPLERDAGNMGDGGPMKISELSFVEMDYEDESNNSEVDMAELQPPTSSSPTIEIHHSDELTSNRVETRGFSSHDVISKVNDDVISKINDDDISKINDDIISKFSKDGIFKIHDDVTSDVMIGKSSDVIENERDAYEASIGSNVDGEHAGLKGTRRDPTEIGRQRRENRDNWGSSKENKEGDMYGHYPDRGYESRGNDDEELLIKRASAAMKRADKLVQETCLEQGKIPKETGTSVGLLNWSSVDGALSWHPTDMSTPVVNDKFMNRPLAMPTTDVSRIRRHQVSDLDSYNNLLSSFAKSKLDQGQRSHGPVDSTAEKLLSSNLRNRARTTALETRARRCLKDIGNSGSQNSSRDVYLSGRYGYNGTLGKRYSWPPWKTSRNRYLHLSGRAVSPTIPCVELRQRRRAIDSNASKIRRSEEFKKFMKPFDHYNKKYDDYFDGMHSNARKGYFR